MPKPAPDSITSIAEQLAMHRAAPSASHMRAASHPGRPRRCAHASNLNLPETNDVHEGLVQQSETSNAHEGLPINY